MLKIRRPLGRLIFNMGIAIPGKTVFLIETAPWSHRRMTTCSLSIWNQFPVLPEHQNQNHKYVCICVKPFEGSLYDIIHIHLCVSLCMYMCLMIHYLSTKDSKIHAPLCQVHSGVVGCSGVCWHRGSSAKRGRRPVFSAPSSPRTSERSHSNILRNIATYHGRSWRYCPMFLPKRTQWLVIFNYLAISHNNIHMLHLFQFQNAICIWKHIVSSATFKIRAIE